MILVDGSKTLVYSNTRSTRQPFEAQAGMLAAPPGAVDGPCGGNRGHRRRCPDALDRRTMSRSRTAKIRSRSVYRAVSASAPSSRSKVSSSCSNVRRVKENTVWHLVRVDSKSAAYSWRSASRASASWDWLLAPPKAPHQPTGFLRRGACRSYPNPDHGCAARKPARFVSRVNSVLAEVHVTTQKMRRRAPTE